MVRGSLPVSSWRKIRSAGRFPISQIEIQSSGTGPFSRGGDSGSLVYREDGVAIGLLFAGSESGGDNGSGLTYVNPIDAVLAAFGATLV